MQGLKCSDSMLGNDVFLILIVAHIVGGIRKQVNESIRDETDEVHRLLLCPHVSWQSLFNDLI